MKNLLLPAGLRLLTVLVFSLGVVRGADFAVKLVEKEPPKELSEAIRKTLQPSAVQLLDGGKPVYEFWFVREVPLMGKVEAPDAGLKMIREAALLGAANVHQAQRDYKDNEVRPGVYTTRFVLQPQDGNHLGTALYPYFAALIPAKLDASPDAFTAYKPVVKASGKETASGHPVVLSLHLPSSKKGDPPTLTEPEPEHKAIRLQLSGQEGESDPPAKILFELVFQGHGEVQ